MKYKAILRTSAPLTRPVQIFSNSPVVVFKWATETLAGQSDPDATVEIYELGERLMEVVKCDPVTQAVSALESREWKIGPKS
jgi:hypothetical protein